MTTTLERPATATATTTSETLRPYPIDQTWKRGRSGLYVARLTGSDPRYGVGREFLNGKAVKSRGTIEFGPKSIGPDHLPCWILRRPEDPCSTCGQGRPVRDTGEDVIAAHASGWQLYGRLFGTADLLEVHNAGRPGDPGAWDGQLCEVCEVSPVVGPGDVCGDCHRGGLEENRIAADRAAAPDEVPF